MSARHKLNIANKYFWAMGPSPARDEPRATCPGKQCADRAGGRSGREAQGERFRPQPGPDLPHSFIYQRIIFPLVYEVGNRRVLAVHRIDGINQPFDLEQDQGVRLVGDRSASNDQVDEVEPVPRRSRVLRRPDLGSFRARPGCTRRRMRPSAR